LCNFIAGDFNIYEDYALFYLALKQIKSDKCVNHTHSLNISKSWESNKTEEIRKSMNHFVLSTKYSFEVFKELLNGVNNSVNAITNTILEIFQPIAQKNIACSH
jgi:esterase/lipase